MKSHLLANFDFTASMTASSTTSSHHILKNLSLIALAISVAPFAISIAFISHVLAPYTKTAKHIKHHRKWRAESSSTFQPRTVLVTGVGMSKGLTLARTFYRAGHRVIGADIESGIPVCGRFSFAIEKFYKLPKPTSESGAEYIKELMSIVEREKVELWVGCSGPASQMIDGEASEVIEKSTNCVAIQFGSNLTSTLHDKHSFIENTREIGLNVPASHLVTSPTEAFSVLYSEKARQAPGNKYIMKSVGWDINTQVDMTLLPLPTSGETEMHIRRINPTPFKPFVLQQFISGPEYCTHSLILNGKIRAFVACPSAELLMHYEALPASSALSQAMLLYTSIYVKKTGPTMNGHFSIDFLVDEKIARKAELKMGVSMLEVKELMSCIYPIECNPRPNTAGVLFADESEDLAEAYLSILPDHEPKGISNGHRGEELIVPRPDTPLYYWIGHDLVTLVLLPVLEFLRHRIGLFDIVESWVEFAEHVIYWRDGTFETWDPYPLCWLYLGYWPAMFLSSLWQGKEWNSVNVSTLRMFEH